MNRQAVYHQSTRAYVLPLDRMTLSFRVLAAANDIAECRLYYFKRSEPYPASVKEAALIRRYGDRERDDFRAEIRFPEPVHYIKYYFRLTGRDGEMLYLNEYGLYTDVPKAGFFEFLYVNGLDAFKTPDWCKGITYYQIFPERFAMGDPGKVLHTYEPWDSAPTRQNFLGGDIKGILTKLGYVRSLGAGCLYLNPVFHGDFNHKYATTDYYAIDPDFGTNEDFRTLVRAAHDRGIRVVLDGVFNHVGVHFPPFADVMEKGEASPYKDWFYVKSFPLAMEPLNYECVGDYPFMPKLHTAHPEVREMVLSVALYWLREYHIDGWRMDVADEVDFSTWQYIRARVKQEFPDALLLGETWGDGSKLAAYGDQLDSVMNYPFRDAMVDYFARGAIGECELDHRLNRMLMRYPDHVNLGLYNCLDSHDTARFLTEAGGDTEKLKLAAAFMMTFIGSPALYYGDEVGMAGENDPGCRASMVWESSKQNLDLLSYYKKLAEMRATSEALRLGSYQTVICDEEKRLFGFARCSRQKNDHESVYVLFNRSDIMRSVPLPRAGKAQDMVTNETLDFAEGPGAVLVPPRSVKIILITGGEKPCVS